MTVAAKDKENKEVTMLELLFCPCWCAVCTASATNAHRFGANDKSKNIF